MSTPLHATDLLAELPRLRRYARVLTGDSDLADRLVEETLVRFRRIPGELASPSARTLELLSLLRTVNSEKARSGAHPASAANPVSVGAGYPRPAKWIQGQGTARPLPDRAVQMLARLGELPPEQREVLVLVAVEQLSYADIATLLRIPVAAVVARLAQAREALHEVSTKPCSAPNNAS
jgi:RNA polymerase sigma-70 factor (ECF subfamily)